MALAAVRGKDAELLLSLSVAHHDNFVYTQHMNFVYVALGGALGAILRYALSLVTVKIDFPLMTFLTNLIGAFLIGLIAGTAVKKNMNQNLVLFLKTGFCGGFTTFSTFSLEAFNLLESGAYVTAGLYILLSLVCCIAGVALGMAAAR